jgi:homopolymeric O-antigen transport system ATP-binding protein
LREALAASLSAPFKRLRNGQNPPETIWALKKVDFEVQPGQVLGIIGRNGAGKSTLLKILSRITEPTTGRAELYGRVGSLLEVGTGFHPELTGRENVLLNGAILGMKRADILRKFDEIVAFAEVEKFIDTPVKYYSSGMYMRLAFAVAAHLDPEILIVDEVLAVGDAAFQKKCLGKMGNVAREGRTILFVSHNLAAVHSLCDTGVVLTHGVAEFFGTVGEAIQHYGNSLRSPTLEDMKGIHGVRVLSTRVIAGSDQTSLSPDQTSLNSDSSLTASFDFHTDRRLPKCYLNLVIEDVDGRFLIHSRTDWFDARPTFEAGLHNVTIEIPRLSLRAGMYTLWFRLYVNSDDITEMIDSERVPLYVKSPQVGGLLDVPCKWSWKAGELWNHEP